MSPPPLAGASGAAGNEGKEGNEGVGRDGIDGIDGIPIDGIDGIDGVGRDGKDGRPKPPAFAAGGGGSGATENSSANAGPPVATAATAAALPRCRRTARCSSLEFISSEAAGARTAQIKAQRIIVELWSGERRQLEPRNAAVVIELPSDQLTVTDDCQLCNLDVLQPNSTGDAA